MKSVGRVPPAAPDAFSLRSRDIIKVFIVTPAHCCKEFFLRPSCRVKSIVSIRIRVQARKRVVNASPLNRRLWMVFLDLHCRCGVHCLLHIAGTGSSPGEVRVGEY